MGSNVSKKEANVHNVSIGNRYNKTILVKYDVQEKFVTLEEFAIKGGVTAAGFGAEGGGRQKKQYDWNKINIQFTPIRPGKFLYRKVTNEDVFLSIITEDEDVIVNTWYVSKNASFVVTEEMVLMEADDKDPLKVHKDYEKIYQEPRASKSSEDKERVTEDMDLMKADDKDPLKVHKDYEKIYQEPRASKSSEDKERVTEDMDLMKADDKNPLKVHKDYVQIYQEPRASKSSEDKERDR